MQQHFSEVDNEYWVRLVLTVPCLHCYQRPLVGAIIDQLGRKPLLILAPNPVWVSRQFSG